MRQTIKGSLVYGEKKQTNKQANMTKYNAFSNKLNECRNHWVACVLHFQMTAAIAVDRLQVPSSSFFLLLFSRQSFVITFKLSSVLVLSSVRGLYSPKTLKGVFTTTQSYRGPAEICDLFNQVLFSKKTGRKLWHEITGRRRQLPMCRNMSIRGDFLKQRRNIEQHDTCEV